MSETLDLPLIIAGRKRYAASGDDVISFRTETGVQVRVPRLTRDDLAVIDSRRETAADRLAKMTVRELVTFLSEAGNRWMDPNSAGRKLVTEHAAKFAQLSPNMIDHDCYLMGAILSGHHFTYDAIASEFGSERFLDEWIPEQMCFRRGFPRGLVLHYLVGNIPMASQYSLIRGIITKNMNLAKWARRDPITPIGLAESFLETDPQHPVSQCLSLAYWNHDDAIGDEAVDAADAICVWGGEEAVRTVKRKVRGGVPVAEYGPRWSAAVIDLDRSEAEEAAYRLVEDVAYYDQEACLNVQRAFVKGDVRDLVDRLRRHFETFQKVYPLGTVSKDAFAHRSLSVTEAEYLGWEVQRGTDWAVVVVDDPADITGHPLGRTLYIHPVKDLAEVAPHLTRRTQSLSVFPWALGHEHGPDWIRRGADRITDLGQARAPRSGWAHDGSLALHSLVKIATIERPLDEHSKYWYGNDHEAWLRSRFRLDLAMQPQEAPART